MATIPKRLHTVVNYAGVAIGTTSALLRVTSELAHAVIVEHLQGRRKVPGRLGTFVFGVRCGAPRPACTTGSRI